MIRYIWLSLWRKDRILKRFKWSFSETETSLSLSCESVSLNKTIKNITQWRSSRLGGPVLHAVPFSLLFPVKSLSGIFIWIDYYHNLHAQNAIKVSCLLPRLLLCCRSCPSSHTLTSLCHFISVNHLPSIHQIPSESLLVWVTNIHWLAIVSFYSYLVSM